MEGEDVRQVQQSLKKLGYKIKVDGVNTIMMRGKTKRVRYAIGRTPDWKKAIVTLKEGNKIDVT